MTPHENYPKGFLNWLREGVELVDIIHRGVRLVLRDGKPVRGALVEEHEVDTVGNTCEICGCNINPNRESTLLELLEHYKEHVAEGEVWE